MKQIFTFLLIAFCALSNGFGQIALPYAEDLEAEATGGTTCGNAQVFTTLNWTNVTTDDQDWVIDFGGTSSTQTGPSFDYNPGTATGNYLYVETSSPCYGSSQQAILESDNFYSNGTESNLFFEFAYHLYGQSMGDLQVNIREVSGGIPGPWTGLDTLSGDLGDVWLIGSYNLSSFVGDTFQIQFVSIAGTNFFSDMALDDFRIFSIEADDAGITSIDGPSSPATSGLNNVAVAIQNFGFNNLTTAMINWELNGVLQTPFAYTAPLTGLPTGSSEGGVNIGSANLGNGLFTVKAWSTMPNGMIDVVSANDTAFATGCSGALRGTYTVGGPSADFVDMTSLGFVLSNCGIDSHTVINVNPGFYNERLILETVPGTSDTSTLTIDGGDASLTTISNGTFSTIYLNGTSYTTIKNLTIEATGTTDCYGIQLRDSASFNMIDSCIILMDDSTLNLADVAGVSASNLETSTSSEGLNAFWTTVSNCLISGGQYGIRFEGQSANRNIGNSFINNTLVNVEDYGFYIDDQDSIAIVGNTISGLRNNFADAIYCFDLMMFNISGNTAYNVPDWGLYIADGNFDAVPTSRGIIVNNMISSTTDNAARFDDVEETDIFHNTFASATTITSTGAVYINDPIDLDIRNNIFYCEGSFAFYTPDASLPVAAGTVDYNIYFGTGTNLIDVGALYADLAAWQTADATRNAGSLETDPLFLGGLNDFHLFAPSLDDLGDNTVGIAVDIDGDARPAGVNVDIGADEFTPLQDDAGVSAIENPISPATVGLNDVIVSVTNFGADTLESVNIEWELDGVPQTPLAHSDSLLSGDTRTGVVIGSTNVSAGAFYNIKAWTTLPNGVADLQNANDTTEILGCGALRGVYTLGGVGADFPDITTLSNVLSSCGIDSTTIININPGVYNERLILDHVPGTNNTITLTIDGGSVDSVTLSNDIFSTIYFDGSHFITVKNIRIEATGSTDSYGVQMRDSASYNTIDSCVIIMNDTTTNLNDIVGINSSDNETTDTQEGKNAYWNTISNNTIIGGELGIRLEGQSTNRNIGNSIINNQLINQEDYGIYLDDQDSIAIVGNTISGLRNNFADAIYCFDLMMFNISENIAFDVPDYGLYIADGNFDAVPTSRGKIVNNMVSSVTDFACYLDDIEEVDIFHNSFANSSTTSGGMRINDFTGLDIRNNIFYSTGDFAFESDDDISATPNTIDFNAYFSSGANLIDDLTTLHTDLASWQLAQPGFNVNSVEGDPVFINGISDLHVLGISVNDVGDNTVGVLSDVDNQARPQAPSSTVDIGADEFTPLSNEAVALEILGFSSICGDNVTQINVLVQSLGLNDVINLPIEINYSGSSSGTLNFTYTDTLSFGEIDTVNVGFVSTFDGGDFDFNGFITLAGDQIASTDTFPTLSVEFVSAIPLGVNAYTCGTDSALLAVDAYPGAAYNWFASIDPLDTIPVGTGSSYLATAVTGVDTYYVAYQPSTPGSLTTTFAGGNGCGGGAMFDINAFTDISMNALDVNTDVALGANTTVTVHFIANSTFVGNEVNAAAWTTLGTFPAVSAGAGNPTFVDFNGASLTIPSGQQYAIYVEYQADYTNGTTTYSNADIEIRTGAGLCNSFGSTNTGRMFNGTVYYGTVGCSNVRTPVLAITSPGVSVDLGGDTLVCGNSLDLDAGTDADFYSWSTNDTLQVVTVTSSGQYDVVVSDSVGCTANDTIDITIQLPPTLAVGNDTTLCGEMFTINATVDSSLMYLWSNNDTTFSTMVDSSGTYSLVVTDTVGCASSDTVEVTLNPNPTVDLGNDSVLCGNLELSANNPTASYNWSTGDTTEAIIVNATDSYSVVVTDGNGCEGTDSIDLTFLPDATLDTAVSVCGSFTWIDGNTYVADTLVSLVVAGGAANGCDSIINLDLDLTIIDTTVGQAGATLTANAVGVTYQWVDCDNGNVAIAGATAQSFTPTANGNYAVQISDNGCLVQSACFNVTGLSIRGLADASLMHLYPNPTENMLTIDFGSVVQDIRLRVMTVDGRTMQEHVDVNGQIFELSLDSYPQGLYFVEVTTKEGRVTSLKVSKF